MAVNPTSIQRLATADVRSGRCGICDRPATLFYREMETGQLLGRCCVEIAIKTDVLLNRTPGLCRPNPTVPQARPL